MDLSSLRPAKGAVKKGKRIARGEGSGKGGTSTKGHKGAQSRSGYSRKLGFEGGQMPLQRRVPKFGFSNPNRVEYKAVNLGMIQGVADKTSLQDITFDVLKDNGIVSRGDLVKVLGGGEFTSKLNITANAFSASALEAIEKAGGNATVA